MHCMHGQIDSRFILRAAPILPAKFKGKKKILESR